MKGTFDEASLRLAKALQRSPEHVEAALAEVGVDAPYLSRALAEGDPQGAIDAVSARLGVPQRDLVTALARSTGAEPPRPAAPQAPSPDAVQDFLARGLPRLLRRMAAVAFVLGAALGLFASLALWRPDLFLALLVYVAAALAGVFSLLLLGAAWRMRRAAAALRRSGPRVPSTKR